VASVNGWRIEEDAIGYAHFREVDRRDATRAGIGAAVVGDLGRREEARRQTRAWAEAGEELSGWPGSSGWSLSLAF
jgi:hypothetical protein